MAQGKQNNKSKSKNKASDAMDPKDPKTPNQQPEPESPEYEGIDPERTPYHDVQGRGGMNNSNVEMNTPNRDEFH
jgi:hypothetical protein